MMTMSPPRPPSPPSGPPIGTNFSRRNEVIPDPPSPAFTCTTTRSMNIPLFPLDPRPQQTPCLRPIGAEQVGKRVNGRRDDRWRDAHVQRATQMRVKLARLILGRTRCNDAELTPLQIEPL